MIEIAIELVLLEKVSKFSRYKEGLNVDKINSVNFNNSNISLDCNKNG